MNKFCIAFGLLFLSLLSLTSGKRTNWKDGPKAFVPTFKGDPFSSYDVESYIAALNQFKDTGLEKYVNSFWKFYHMAGNQGLNLVRFERFSRQLMVGTGDVPPSEAELVVAFQLIDRDGDGMLQKTELIEGTRDLLQRYIIQLTEYMIDL